ncbi:alpha/beta fold hydrolase [Candidatus Woesearchaeota archaeon]|nr:alpha/beta fold hydrolase [Candidatus Woesearchaeota archaeon]
MPLEDYLDSATAKRRSYTLTLQGAEGPLDARLYLPAAEGTYPAILMNGGLLVDPLAQPALLWRNLTNMDAAVLIPRYRGHVEDRLVTSDADSAVQAFQYLQGLDEVLPERVGMVGFSYGGMLSLLAAADPAISRNVRYVVSIGGPTDIEEMLTFALTDPDATDSIVQIVRDSLRDTALEFVEQQEALPRKPFAKSNLPDIYRDYVNISRLLRADTTERIRALLDDLTPETRKHLHRLSPIEHAESLYARTFFIHGRDDRTVPLAQSEQMHRKLRSLGRETHLARVDGYGHGIEVDGPLRLLGYLRGRGKEILSELETFMRR